MQDKESKKQDDETYSYQCLDPRQTLVEAWEQVRKMIRGWEANEVDGDVNKGDDDKIEGG